MWVGWWVGPRDWPGFPLPRPPIIGGVEGPVEEEGRLHDPQPLGVFETARPPTHRGSRVLNGAWDGMGMCPAPVLTWPEAPGTRTCRLTYQGVAGSPALDSGATGHRRPRATQAQ